MSSSDKLRLSLWGAQSRVISPVQSNLYEDNNDENLPKFWPSKVESKTDDIYNNGRSEGID